jgi:hypothetical protein
MSIDPGTGSPLESASLDIRRYIREHHDESAADPR